MEVDDIQMQGCKFQRIGNNRNDDIKIGQKGNEQYADDEEDLQVKRSGAGAGAGAGGSDLVTNRIYGWPSSRIVRVSRASGGKDRHSKVWTSKGLRDRRVRLSVTTAIQFYDLQDRLGYDQPSKAVEWLLKAAASSIAELPSLNASFPNTPNQISDEKRPSTEGNENAFDSAEVEFKGDQNYQQQQQRQHNVSLSKSACSSNSETSKGSGLSLSRSESRMKARERARGRAAEKEKEKENESRIGVNQNQISQNSSFTELLTAGINNVGNSTTSPNGSSHQNQSPRNWSSAPMGYFSTGLVNPSSSRAHHPNGWGNTIPQFSITGDQNHELQHFSFVPENLVSSTGAGSDYNLNFSISSGLAGFNRGTLQSNSPSFLPHLQRYSSIDGSNIPFFIGTTAPNAVPVENHHLYPTGIDGRLQLCYGDGGRHSGQKGKGKN